MKINNALFESGQYIETMSKIHQSRQLTVMDAYRINRLIKQVTELQTEYATLKSGLLNVGILWHSKQRVFRERNTLSPSRSFAERAAWSPLAYLSNRELSDRIVRSKDAME